MTERDEHEPRDRREAPRGRDEAIGPAAPGNLDAMPHIYQPAEGARPLDEEGNVIPPARESGRAGNNDLTWQAGKPKPTFDTDAKADEQAP
jgi:hypothetical protein